MIGIKGRFSCHKSPQTNEAWSHMRLSLGRIWPRVLGHDGRLGEASESDVQRGPLDGEGSKVRALGLIHRDSASGKRGKGRNNMKTQIMWGISRESVKRDIRKVRTLRRSAISSYLKALFYVAPGISAPRWPTSESAGRVGCLKTPIQSPGPTSTRTELICKSGLLVSFIMFPQAILQPKVSKGNEVGGGSGKSREGQLRDM
ncbi:hypothetical protein EDB83DRAFT_2321277 [Lactarius deliciosus]|nr:hypothetical protein EDB83DRAFT_2321277 [Lactarius deliciosus]